MLGFFSARDKDLSLIGKRVKIIFMDDADPIPPETTGVIFDIDGAGHYQVKWDNGRSLAIIPDEDKFVFLENEEIKK
jgi:hypothetical protein